ncbi:hypothetical protein G8A07_06985 [Roseateles sp. DAIF2]|uniref:hypothetical protein n=1 Tax=Roseateles sp. DAIF2 TaxID=2714952 RepID=UPI0018A3138A|nr:hypothetical protein [Roseateles sp. DAIF2]QPF72697.1 hypothetical protein G8A07_06985 [Roseateles sp. DAIF2]
MLGRKFILHLEGGGNGNSAPLLGGENLELFRITIGWMIWGGYDLSSMSRLKIYFAVVRRVFVLCESEGIVASRLSRHPKVIEKLVSLFNDEPSREVLLVAFNKLLPPHGSPGFTVFDESALTKLVSVFADKPVFDETEQTAYIPPRIWVYATDRLHECLSEYLTNAANVKKFFDFCVKAYVHNFVTFEAAVQVRNAGAALPFTKYNRKAHAKRLFGKEPKYFGSVEENLKKFGIFELVSRWVNRPVRGFDIRQFSAYLSLVQSAASMYIPAFTFQRKEEVGPLRADCLIWEHVELIGRIPIIRGETTKTDPDSDARWPASPSVELAVRAAGHIAGLQLSCAKRHPIARCSDADLINPLLFQSGFEPWSTQRPDQPYWVVPPVNDLKGTLSRFPRLFDAEVMMITAEDLKSALRFTPNLNKNNGFAVGQPWPLQYHQFRRTGAINMLGSGLVSDTSVQVLMKHSHVTQTMYYGKNFSRLKFNEEVLGVCTAAKYEVMGRQLQALVKEQYISPLGEERKDEMLRSLLPEKEFKQLVAAGMRGEITFRETRLGGCTNNSHCSYGGVEGVAACVGGEKQKPCREAIFDKEKRVSIAVQLKDTEAQKREAKAGSPREAYLKAEAFAMNRFLKLTA